MGSIVAPLAAGLGAGLVGKAFEKGPPKVDRSKIPTGIYTAGVNARPVSSGQVRVDLTPERREVGQQLSRTYEGLSRELGKMRGRVGSGELVQAGLERYKAARDRAQSTLRANLARRKILGSSFASNTLGATDLDFAQQEALFMAEQKQRDIEVETDLLVREHQAAAAAYQQRIADLDLPTDIGLKLQSNLAGVHGELSKLDAELASRHRGGAAALGTTIFSEMLAYQTATGRPLIDFSGAGGFRGRNPATGYRPPIATYEAAPARTYGYGEAPAGANLSGAPLFGY